MCVGLTYSRIYTHTDRVEYKCYTQNRVLRARAVTLFNIRILNKTHLTSDAATAAAANRLDRIHVINPFIIDSTTSDQRGSTQT